MPHVKANGVNLHYELTGPAGAPVIVFSHSIGASLEMWDAQVTAFAGRYRCLRYDTRGHGSSEVIDRPATVDDLADDLAGLLDALDIAKAHIVGLSLGGMMGQAFALRHPQKLDRLVLVSTSAKMDVQFYRDRETVARREGYGSFIETVLVPRWFTQEFGKASPEVIDAFRQRFPKDWRGYSVCCGVIAALDLPERIGGIRAPTMIMVGAADPATPVAMSLDLLARIPDAELITRAAWKASPTSSRSPPATRSSARAAQAPDELLTADPHDARPDLRPAHRHGLRRCDRRQLPR
jgi:3-oxoadipate enol-lactonase